MNISHRTLIIFAGVLLPLFAAGPAGAWVHAGGGSSYGSASASHYGNTSYASASSSHT